MSCLSEIFVSHKIAKKLNNIEFDVETLAYYDANKQLCVGVDMYQSEDFISNQVIAPTYEQVFSWFTEKNIIGAVLPYLRNKFIWKIWDKRTENVVTYTTKLDEGFDTYKQTQEKLICKIVEIYKKEKQLNFYIT